MTFLSGIFSLELGIFSLKLGKMSSKWAKKPNPGPMGESFQDFPEFQDFEVGLQ